MSSHGNRKSIMPDVSPRPRSDFTVRDRTIAIMILAAVIAIITLTIGALTVSNNEENTKTAAALKEREEALVEAAKKLAEREKELDLRESKLNTRETNLSNREAALETAQVELERSQSILQSDIENFNLEEEASIAKQFRLKELCEALLLELTPEDDE